MEFSSDVRKHIDNNYIAGGIISLGHGGTLIARAACKRSGTLAAVKYIPVTGKHHDIRREQRRAAHQEAAISLWLSHPNLIKCIESFSSRNEIAIVFEYCAGGDLLDYVVKRGPINEDKAKVLFFSIASALQLCHKNGVAHRDVKLENIFLRTDGTPVLGDFGMAARYVVGEKLTNRAGSTPYMAPEQTDDEPLSIDPEAADVFAFGVVMFAVLKGKWPFTGETRSEWVAHISSGHYDIGTAFSPSLRQLIMAMMCVDPLLRPTFEEMLVHEWCEPSECYQDQWQCEL